MFPEIYISYTYHIHIIYINSLYIFSYKSALRWCRVHFPNLAFPIWGSQFGFPNLGFPIWVPQVGFPNLLKFAWGFTRALVQMQFFRAKYAQCNCSCAKDFERAIFPCLAQSTARVNRQVLQRPLPPTRRRFTGRSMAKHGPQRPRRFTFWAVFCMNSIAAFSPSRSKGKLLLSAIVSYSNCIPGRLGGASLIPPAWNETSA